MNKSNPNLNDNIWYLFAGCGLVGLGLGMAIGDAGAGLIIGAGVGFLAMVAAPYIKR